MRKKMVSLLCILAALFCFAYCAVVFMIRSGSRFYLVWAAGGICLAGLFCLLHFGLWDRAPLLLRRSFCLLATVGVVLFVIVEGCIISHYRDRGRENLDYIIVLGAQMKEKGPSAVLQFRLDAAYEYLLSNEGTICIVSGGQGRNEPCSEAEGMYEYLTKKGIPAERILKEDRSTDTSENIAYSAELIGRMDISVGIVTNNFHVFRGIHLAKAAGFQEVCGIAARSNVYFQLNNMVREFFGILKDFAFGNFF
ncbi:MAG: YdcF family protein [Lachnospiraceae bacterium]|nr:YdcF family protein [Lachnospiraceae bacterium]